HHMAAHKSRGCSSLAQRIGERKASGEMPGTDLFRGIDPKRDMHLSNLKKRLERLASQFGFKRSIANRISHDAKNGIVGIQELLHITLTMCITHIMRSKTKDAARKNFLHEKRLDLPKRVRSRSVDRSK